jgi:hypothetical protein
LCTGSVPLGCRGSKRMPHSRTLCLLLPLRDLSPPSDAHGGAGLVMGWVGHATRFLFPFAWRSSSRALWHWVTPQLAISYSFSSLVMAVLSPNDPFVYWFFFREVSLIPLSWFCVLGATLLWATLAGCRHSKSNFLKRLFCAAYGDA